MTGGVVPVGGIEIAYETVGRTGDPPVVLVSGLGSQMIGWDDSLCASMAARGHQVIRFDNRDVGASTHLHDAPRPDPRGAAHGDLSSVSYTLADMADDVAGLLDALGLDSAHIVGASMGGMIAQLVAIAHPDRVRSLTSIMSTTGAPDVGDATPEAGAALFAPPAHDRSEYVERAVASARLIGSPRYPAEEEQVRERAAFTFDRSYDPLGVARQLVAIFASGDRTADLAKVTVPTLVVHGRDDALIHVSGGQATAAAIPGAELLVLDGVGHDIPRELWDPLLDRVTALIRVAEERLLERR